MNRVIVSFTRVDCVGVWFGFVRFALLLAVVLCWVARCFGSWVLLGLFCLLRVTQIRQHRAGIATIDTKHGTHTGFFFGLA